MRLAAKNGAVTRHNPGWPKAFASCTSFVLSKLLALHQMALINHC